jgi:hypothetical protein
VYQICRSLGDASTIDRNQGTCGKCGRSKLVNKSSLGADVPGKLSERPPISDDRDKRINDIHYQLTLLLQKLKPVPKHVGPNEHINQLLQENTIPNHVATLMHCARKLRNDFTKERIHFRIPSFWPSKRTGRRFGSGVRDAIESKADGDQIFLRGGCSAWRLQSIWRD